jgi:ADP-ribosyl-[dinitrogen reductase] hydrolase
MDRLDRYKGCLLGLAVGDALGTTLEFEPPGSFTPINDMIGGGPFDLNPGQWTDDTSMALCLAESLIKYNGFDPVDQMKRYAMWYHNGRLSSTGTCFDIGNTCLSAITKFERSGEQYCGSTDSHSAGNGSLMRLASIPLFFSSNPEEAIEMSGNSSRTTHGAETCVSACKYFAALIVGALNNVDKETLLSKRYCPIPNYWNDHPLASEIDAIALGSFKENQPPEIKGTVYVVKSLEAALWAFHNSSSFKEGCLMAVNLGDDADTTGAIYGQIAGAYYGISNIPDAWLDKIFNHKLIESFAKNLIKKNKQI